MISVLFHAVLVPTASPYHRGCAVWLSGFLVFRFYYFPWRGRAKTCRKTSARINEGLLRARILGKKYVRGSFYC